MLNRWAASAFHQTQVAKAEKTRSHARPPKVVPEGIAMGPPTTNALEKKKREATGSKSCLRQGRASLQIHKQRQQGFADLPFSFIVLPYIALPATTARLTTNQPF